jgi:hypothetical protein
MGQSEFRAVRCKLSKGIFSTERAFEITLANGEKYSGPAPIHFCWNDSGKPLAKTEAMDDEIDGWVAARPLKQQLPGDQMAVEVPDGEALAVRKWQVRDAWTEIVPPTPAEA